MNLSLTAQALTRQEIFDKAYSGLAAQGFEKSADANEDCSYRGPEGRKCAIGFIIPDERYTPAMETRAADSVADDYLSDLIAIGDLDFIWELQRCHDDALSTVDMQTRLRKFAEGYRLKTREASL